MRFGVCGTGYWARAADAAAIAAHPVSELAAVWGRNAERTRALAAEFGAVPYADLDAMLDAVDAVAVALPPDVQADVAVRAATAGRHLILDKPLALSTGAADRILAAVEAAGVRALVFHTAHFAPENAAWLADLRRDGELHGGAVTLLVSIFEPGNPFGQAAWRREKGALSDVGPHALDMLVSCLGPVDRVVAERGRGDTVHLVLRHASGASSALSLSLTAPPAATTSAWWVYGTRGVSHRPDGPTMPVEAFGHAISALLADGADGWPGHASDVRHGRDIVAVLERAERLLGETPSA